MSPGHWPRAPILRLARGVLWLGSLVVPGAGREAWREEWEAELWVLHRRGAGGASLIRFVLGGAVDAGREGLLMRREAMMGGSGWGQDLRMALRRLARAPGFTAITVLVLALGIGANTALFTSLRATLLQEPPYPEPERLVLVDLLYGDLEAVPDTMPWSYPKFAHVRNDLDVLEGAAAYMRWNVTLAGTGDPRRVDVEIVSPGYFELLGITSARGRLLAAAEERPGASQRVVLSHRLWAERFGGDPAVVGRNVRLNGSGFEVAGVARAGFRGLTGSAELWIPQSAAPVVMDARRLERAWSHWFRVVGRLAPGTGLEAARAGASALGSALTEAFPDPRGGAGAHGVALTRMGELRLNRLTRLAVSAVGVGALLLLLITAANVAGLFLARTAARRADVAVRAALGAGRGRLAREVLMESLLLASAGGVAGLALAWLGEGAVRWAVAYALDTTGSRSLQFLDPASLGMDATVLGTGLGLAVLTGLVFGIVPARAAGRADLVRDLRAGGRGGIREGGRASGYGLRSLLVVGQLALTLVLLSGAGLMLASFSRLGDVALGFDPEGVVAARYELGSDTGPAETRAFEAAVLERLEARPGVEAAALGVCSPVTAYCDMTGLRQIDDRRVEGGLDAPWVHTMSVTPGFFETLRVPLVQGGGLPRGLRPEDPPVAVISEAAAREFFPGIDPVGHRIGVTHSLTGERPAEIVGVAADVTYADLEEDPAPAVYFSSEQAPAGWGQIFVRGSGDPADLVRAVRQAVLAIRPDLPVYDVSTLEARVAVATARTRVILGLLAAFGLAALLLSAVGLYGFVSYTVERRTREVGLRMALGADRGRILGAMTLRPLVLVAAGAAAGVTGALLLTRYLRELLFSVEPWDPLVLSSSILTLLAVAAAAALVPAFRATRVDPVRSLRSE